jgi:hypothetical protein
MTYWLRVDRPLKLCILHEDACEYARDKRETPFLGINAMKRDGGWFSFESYLKARQFFAAEVQVHGIDRIKDRDVCH